MKFEGGITNCTDKSKKSTLVGVICMSFGNQGDKLRGGLISYNRSNRQIIKINFVISTQGGLTFFFFPRAAYRGRVTAPFEANAW